VVPSSTTRLVNVDSAGNITVGNSTASTATITYTTNTATVFNGTVVFGQTYGDIPMGQFGN
jgi:hypothetical protein